MRRHERIGIHGKQSRINIKKGIPLPNDLLEGVTEIRATQNGLTEYVKYKGKLYKKELELV